MNFKAISLAIAIIIPFASSIHSPVSANSNIASRREYQISQSVKQSPGITYKRIGVGGIKLSMSEAQVRKILGKPVKVENGFLGVIGKVRTLKYRGITVDLGEDAKPGSFSVYQIKVTSSKYATIDGIKVGDRQSQVLKTYGKIAASQDGNKTTLNYGVDKPSPAGLIFTMKNGKVTEIFCFDFLG
ncbi:hypothetical protein [Calothrix sp. UHCC 0171]|uniref:hypothetical protein n=1 Tax=Calothrix sp. UHCC 0171 TaxID=3110245 RepID=UPI002B204FDA|nr:hypothetical protein [Calothrix sp. UHCC 0171]MEA5572828.1 hypothetical protein [Calothrix sp. UHCC 0171]